MIDKANVERVNQMVEDALAAGARASTRGRPTVSSTDDASGRPSSSSETHDGRFDDDGCPCVSSRDSPLSLRHRLGAAPVFLSPRVHNTTSTVLMVA